MLKKCFLVVIVLLFIIPLISAQQGTVDTDGDGFADEFDKCQNTPEGEEMPLYTKHPEYTGCSCSQIIRIIGESDCRDFYCVPGRPLEIQDRVFSSRKPICPVDFCLGDTFYDHPVPDYPICVNGVPQPFSCESVVTKNYEGCINGSVPQFFDLEEKKENDYDVQEIVSPVVTDDDKLAERAFSIILNDASLRQSIGLAGRPEFDARKIDTFDSAVIEKSTEKTTKMIGERQVLVTVKKITIRPLSGKVLNDVIIFEEMPRGERLLTTDIVSDIEMERMVSESPILLVWRINKIDGETTITYQVNKDISQESNTLVISKTSSNMLTVFAIPIVLIIIIGLVFYYNFKKNIESKRRIFK